MAGPARILFITRKWAPATGGMETYCVELTRALQEFQPIAIKALPGQPNGMPPGPLALITFGLRTFVQLLFGRAKYDIVHLADMAIWPIGLAAGYKAQVVLSAHGTDVAYHRRGGLRGTLYGYYLRLGAKWLGKARVIANSAATAEMLAQSGWHAASIVPLATTAHSQEPDPSHDGSILFAGRLVERKGCGWFIQNVLPLLPDHMRLKVAGTKWDASESALLNNPRVDFLGTLDQGELAQAYARALCVIVPNIDGTQGEYEGFGLVAPEAASAGGVVLAARSGGLTDAVFDRETGFLLTSGNAPEWAGLIAEISRWNADARAGFTQKARRKAASFYCWDRVARDTSRIYRADPASA